MKMKSNLSIFKILEEWKWTINHEQSLLFGEIRRTSQKNRRKQNKKKKKKIVGTHQAKLAPEARRTKTFSTRILQESFACGSCFTHVF